MTERKRVHTRWNHSVKQKCVEGGLSGLLVTCDGLEKQALAEMYNLIDSILDGEQSSDKPTNVDESADSGDEDIADSIKRICNDTRDNKTKLRRCKQRPTGVKNCLFVTVEGVDILDLAEKLVVKAQKTPCCRHLQRVLPVEQTASVDLKKLSEMISTCVSKHMKQKEDGTYPSYALEFKNRNNDSVKKVEVLEMLNDAISAIAPSAKVNLTGAEVLFYIQVVRKTMMVAGIKNFYGLRKYSMRPAADQKKEAETEA
ncbi:unnamed protein product [Auanema sp. JU1783]|nr:unnamed protein product [Auanema sp. JU1783]